MALNVNFFKNYIAAQDARWLLIEVLIFSSWNSRRWWENVKQVLGLDYWNVAKGFGIDTIFVCFCLGREPDCKSFSYKCYSTRVLNVLIFHDLSEFQHSYLGLGLLIKVPVDQGLIDQKKIKNRSNRRRKRCQANWSPLDILRFFFLCC